MIVTARRRNLVLQMDHAKKFAKMIKNVGLEEFVMQINMQKRKLVDPLVHMIPIVTKINIASLISMPVLKNVP